jgi:hypothetical protein
MVSPHAVMVTYPFLELTVYNRPFAPFFSNLWKIGHNSFVEMYTESDHKLSREFWSKIEGLVMILQAKLLQTSIWVPSPHNSSRHHVVQEVRGKYTMSLLLPGRPSSL